MPNINALSLMLQKDMSKVKVFVTRGMDKQVWRKAGTKMKEKKRFIGFISDVTAKDALIQSLPMTKINI